MEEPCLALKGRFDRSDTTLQKIRIKQFVHWLKLNEWGYWKTNWSFGIEITAVT